MVMGGSDRLFVNFRLPIFKQSVIKQIINIISNYRHRILISLMYGAGLRVSEVVKLKHVDLELSEGIGWVRKGKGNKDRPFIIPICLKEDLFSIIESNKNKKVSSF